MQQDDQQPPWRYIKPTSSDPTPHILIGGPESDLLKLPGIFRSINLQPTHLTKPVLPRQCCCYASFETAEQALAAIKSINKYDLGSRRRFAALYADIELLPDSHRPHHTASPDPPFLPATTDATSCNIPGLYLLKDFITTDEEQAMLDCLDSHPWDALAKRRIQHYGKVFSYAYRTYDSTSPARDIPHEIQPILDRIHQFIGLLIGATTTTITTEEVAEPDIHQQFDQLTVNEYTPGVGISPHIETHSAFTDVIVSLSLSGSAAMSFRRTMDGTLHQRALFLPQRSLVVLCGEARFAWEHSIPHRKKDLVVESTDNTAVSHTVEVPRNRRRVSLTFRRIRSIPCRCKYPDDCDNQQGKIVPTRMAALLEAQKQKEGGVDAGCGVQGDHDINPSAIHNANANARSSNGNGTTPQQLEDSNVRDVYDIIASHFSSTRFAVWPKVKQFILSLPVGSIVADVGCGNGKYFAIRRDIFVSGSDRSKGLAEVASRRLCPAGMPLGHRPLADVAVADGMGLPYRHGVCDGVLCIAVLHHVSTVPRRIHMLKEMAKVLRPGGKALVTVWATEQENMKKVASWQPLGQSIRDNDSDDGGGDGGGDIVEDTSTGTGCGRAANGTCTNGTHRVTLNENDYLVPWHLPTYRANALAVAGRAHSHVDSEKNTFVFKRYYHLFVPGELEELVGHVDGARVVDSFYDKDNWCVIFEKLS